MIKYRNILDTGKWNHAPHAGNRNSAVTVKSVYSCFRTVGQSTDLQKIYTYFKIYR
jgi:hypothetical protein